LLVLSLPEGKELFRTDEKAVSLGGFTWVAPKTLAYLERPLPDPTTTAAALGPEAADEKKEPEPKQRLVELDFQSSPPKTSIANEALEGEQLGSPAASPDGKLIALQRRSDDGLHLGIFDRDSKKVTAHDVGGWVENPAVSPDGKQVVFERSSDIALYSRDSGKTRALTKNAFVERYPIFSADGARVAFETRDRDPNFPSRGVSLVASVPVR
jgi:Tol biopolymer transport system component